MSRSYYVYIMSSKPALSEVEGSGVLYVGSTNDLERRVFEHKQGLIEGFTRRYRVTRLVYVEEFDGPAAMVERERQLKGWTRRRKLELIHTQNPEMIDYARRTARDPSLRQPALRVCDFFGSRLPPSIRRRCAAWPKRLKHCTLTLALSHVEKWARELSDFCTHFQDDETGRATVTRGISDALGRCWPAAAVSTCAKSRRSPRASALTQELF